MDGSFEGLHLAEEELLLAVGSGPIGEQPARRRRDADVAALPPELHAGADLVDEPVLLDPVLRPLGIESKLVLALLARLGDGDEVGTGAAAGLDFVGDSFVVEAEMTGRLAEGRVDDRVLDDDLRHGRFSSLALMSWGCGRATLDWGLLQIPTRGDALSLLLPFGSALRSPLRVNSHLVR